MCEGSQILTSNVIGPRFFGAPVGAPLEEFICTNGARGSNKRPDYYGPVARDGLASIIHRDRRLNLNINLGHASNRCGEQRPNDNGG